MTVDYENMLVGPLFSIMARDVVYTPINCASQVVKAITQTGETEVPEIFRRYEGSVRTVPGLSAYLKLSEVPEVKRGDQIEIDSVVYDVDAELENNGYTVRVSLTVRV